MNTNLLHNILNFAIALVAILGVPEVVALIPTDIAITITGFAATAKLIINLLRDGLGGLAKAQPPAV